MISSKPRVRFAPSPTGALHVGGLRTALYNYLFARRQGGTLLLRIEDTDRARYVAGAAEKLAETLAWAGITFDEGPGIGGDHGPYVQSERSDLYRAHAMRLLEEGKAYRCFCTSEELEAARLRQARSQQDSAYDRHCRTLTDEHITERLDQNQPHTIRLLVPLAGELQFRDLIRGDVAIHYDVIDDQVLLKSDGLPTYHLANVVDDHHMEITHVIRGEEWLPSTPKHLLLYEYFGWTPPSFAHLPLLLNADRTKLSKRQGDVAVEDYRAAGYLPEALVNFIALLGWNPGDDRELFSLQELEQSFTLDRVSKAGAVFDIEKLKWFNAQYLRALPPETLAEYCGPFMRSAGFDTADSDRTAAVASAFAAYLTIPSDIVSHLRFLTISQVTFEDEEDIDTVSSYDAQKVLAQFAYLTETLDTWNASSVKDMIKDIQNDTGVKGKKLFMPLRLALTGERHGPDIGLIAELLGRDACLRRIRSQLV
ncbi:MAG: glutamate--tRNA ligase [Bacteroidetes bacterium]|nr:glutamate--tRNA ligase [Bacteroidota bacterium]